MPHSQRLAHCHVISSVCRDGRSNHMVSLSLSIHLSIFFAHATTFGLFQAIRRHFLAASDQTDTNCCITASAWACNRPDSPRLFFYFTACLSLLLCFPVASRLSPNTCCPLLCFLLRESAFCPTQVPANKVWRPAINERAHRTAFPPSWQLRETVSTVSALNGSRPPFLGSLPLPSGIYSCAWSKSLQAFVVMPVHYACTPLHLCACYAFRC